MGDEIKNIFKVMIQAENRARNLANHLPCAE